MLVSNISILKRACWDVGANSRMSPGAEGPYYASGCQTNHLETRILLLGN